MKLKPVGNDSFSGMIIPMLIEGETIIQSFQSIRDGIVFTNKRIFAINVQGFEFLSVHHIINRDIRLKTALYRGFLLAFVCSIG